MDYRSEAEKFVTAFLDYVYKYDIQDEFDKKTQKMIRSPGVEALVKQAESVFPARADDGKTETDKLSKEEVDAVIENNSVVVDRRDVFSRKIQENGASQGLLRRVLQGDQEAIGLALELVKADDGEKEFYVPTKK